MKLKLKEDPKEWRKAALMSALGLAIFSSLLHWRRVLPTPGWLAVLGILVIVAITAVGNPRFFRPWYRFSARLGHGISQGAGYLVLALLFFFLITPIAVALRLMGKDPLRLRRPSGVSSYWSDVKGKPSLDRLY